MGLLRYACVFGYFNARECLTAILVSVQRPIQQSSILFYKAFSYFHNCGNKKSLLSLTSNFQLPEKNLPIFFNLNSQEKRQ